MKRAPARFAAATRAKLARRGGYQRHDGAIIGVRQMAAPHLIYATFVALLEGEPAAVTRTLSAEIVRRRLKRQAMAMAADYAKRFEQRKRPTTKRGRR